ncbi:MAG: LexA family protein [Gammaproteobacteria bacterium]
MDVHQIRIKNLQWLLKCHYRGRQSGLAKALGRKASIIWRLFSTDPGHRRNLGSALAREIERTLGYPQGWMDQVHVLEELSGELTAQAEASIQRSEQTNVVILNPRGHKCVPILTYREAGDWAQSEEPYPMTDKTEVFWTPGESLSNRAFGLRIEDESMVAAFLRGDIVIIDREVLPRPGDFVAAKLKQKLEIIFARYRPRGLDARGKMVIELAPENDDYPVATINRAHPGLIIGTMLVHYRFRRRDRDQAPERRAHGGPMESA